jgi:glycosyltransferase involved in cell wall biosynthesis
LTLFLELTFFNSSFLKKNIDLVLPCYNPPSDFAKLVSEYFQKFKAYLPDREINLYIVNDGSIRNFTDIQIAQLHSLQDSIHIISYPVNRGKGYALRKAIEETKSPLIIYTDYDFPFTFDTKKKLIEELDNGADVVLVSRNHDYLRLLPPMRRFYSISSRLLNKFMLGLKYSETQGGLKGFNEKGKEIFLRTTIDEFLFDTEFIYRASLDKDIITVSILGATRQEIRPNRVPLKVIIREIRNFIKILRIRTQ